MALPAVPALALPLVTPRLLLRDYTLADVKAVYAYTSMPEYWQFQRADAPRPEQLEALLKWVAHEQAASPRLLYFLAAVRKDTGEIVGEAVLKIVDVGQRQGELGFGVAPKDWRQGYGSEIAAAVLAAAFKHFKLHRVAAQCSPDNAGSIRVLQKLGMALEGVLRDLHFARGKWWSASIYGILEQEYAKIRTVQKA